MGVTVGIGTSEKVVEPSFQFANLFLAPVHGLEVATRDEIGVDLLLFLHIL